MSRNSTGRQLPRLPGVHLTRSHKIIRGAPCGREQYFMAPTQAAPGPTRNEIMLDIYDRSAREEMAERLGVSEERLRKAVSLVGSRISSITAYLSK